MATFWLNTFERNIYDPPMLTWSRRHWLIDCRNGGTKRCRNGGMSKWTYVGMAACQTILDPTHAGLFNYLPSSIHNKRNHSFQTQPHNITAFRIVVFFIYFWAVSIWFLLELHIWWMLNSHNLDCMHTFISYLCLVETCQGVVQKSFERHVILSNTNIQNP